MRQTKAMGLLWHISSFAESGACAPAGPGCSRIVLHSLALENLAMVLLRQTVHPRGLSIAQQRKVFSLRTMKTHTKKKMSWEKISMKVVNLQGEHPYWQVCRDAFNQMSARSGITKYKYANCGRRPVLDATARKWLVRRMLALRKTGLCTSTILQRSLAECREIIVEASTVRKALKWEGYKWLRRGHKRRFSGPQLEERRTFVDVVAPPNAITAQGAHQLRDGWCHLDHTSDGRSTEGKFLQSRSHTRMAEAWGARPSRTCWAHALQSTGPSFALLATLGRSRAWRLCCCSVAQRTQGNFC